LGIGAVMKVCLLTSGSIGNAVVIEDGQDSLIIDFGVTLKKFGELISQTCLDASKIRNVLITHEHSDHIKGVGVASRRMGLRVWSTKKTIDAIFQKGILKESDPEVEYVEKYNEYQISGFKVTPFPLSHDAVDPVGYVVEKNGKKIVWLTDTGYVSKDVIDVAKEADIYILEMNHNVEMLHMSHRPWNLKQRILGDYGHLSNEDGAYIFTKLMGENTNHVFLSHISQEANLPDLAFLTMKEVLREQKIDSSKLNIHLTYPLRPSKIIEI